MDMTRSKAWLPLAVSAILLLAACAKDGPAGAADPGPAANLTPPPPRPAPVATRDPAFTPPAETLRPLPLPTASGSERGSAGDTRLYLTAFQNDFVSVVDPVSGRALHQIAVEADQAGMAVSPDGRRLYVVDGVPATQGRLRVFDTATWDVVH